MFSVGNPAILRALPPDLKLPQPWRTVATASSPDRKHIAVISHDVIAIWNTSPYALVACHVRTGISKSNRNVDVCWRPGGSSLVVRTADNTILFYSLKRLDGKFAYRCRAASSPNATTLGADDTRIPVVSLQLVRLVELDRVTHDGEGYTASCMFARSEHIVIATTTCELLFLRWDGLLDEEDTILWRQLVPDLDNHSAYPISIECARWQSRLPNTIVLLLSDGQIVCFILDGVRVTPGDNSVRSTSPVETHAPSSPTATTIASAPLTTPPSTPSSSSFLSFFNPFSLLFPHSPSRPGSPRGSTTTQSDASLSTSQRYTACCCSSGMTASSTPVCLVFCTPMQLIAVADSSGLVCVYTLDMTACRVSPSHRLVLPRQFVSQSRGTGSVLDLDWAPDGHALAVAYQNTGVAVWSTYGQLLCVQPVCECAPDDTSSASAAAFDAGGRSVAWGQLGHSLLVAPNTATSSSGTSGNHSDDLYVFSIVQSAQLRNFNADNSERVFFVGADRVVMRSSDFGTLHSLTSCMNTPSLSAVGSHVRLTNVTSLLRDPHNVVSSGLVEQWRTLMVPSDYVAAHGPLRIAAVDESASVFVVAAARSFAIYRRHHGWRSFLATPRAPENTVVIHSMCFWRGLLVVGASDGTTIASHRVIFYFLPDTNDGGLSATTSTRAASSESSSNKGNDKESARVAQRYSFAVSHRVRHLNVLGDHLVTYTANRRALVHQLTVNTQKPNTMAAHLVHDVDLTAHASPVAAVSAVALLADADGLSLIANIAGSVLLFRLGSAVFDERGGTQHDIAHSSPPLVLSREIEQLWMPRPLSSLRDEMHICSAIYFGRGAHGMQICLPLFEEADMRRVSRRILARAPPNVTGTQRVEDLSSFRPPLAYKRVFVPFPAPFYTLCVDTRLAVLHGIAAEPVDDPGSMMILVQKSRTFLDHLLRTLVRRNLDVYAMMIAQKFSSLRSFTHALELMVHEVLEEEAISMTGYRADAELPRVVQFIARFPQYRAVIGQCARKTEVSCWDYLFSIVGDPRSLFEQCLAADDVSAAATYFLILQSLEPPSSSMTLATRLLDVVLESNRFQLADDLIRFVGAVVSDQDESLAATAVSGDSATTDGKKIFVDIILTRHARKLLLSRRLHALYSFGIDLHFPLTRWLFQERHRAAQIGPGGVVAAFEAIHTEFFLTLPRKRRRGVGKHGDNEEDNEDEEDEEKEEEEEEEEEEGANAVAEEAERSGTSGRSTTSLGVPLLLSHHNSGSAASIPNADDLDALRFLLDAMIASGCYEWAVLAVLALRDVRSMSTVASRMRRDTDFEGGRELIDTEIHVLMQHFRLDRRLLRAMRTSDAFDQRHSCFEVTFS